MNQRMSFSFFEVLGKICQGCLIGVGAVLPGISGGVLCVVFGIYQPVMELLAHPVGNMRKYLPKLLPVIIGGAIGFLGIANILSFFLERFPTQSVCVFIGLIAGMLPNLFWEANYKGNYEENHEENHEGQKCLRQKLQAQIAFLLGMAGIFLLLGMMQMWDIKIAPGGVSYIFCGICLALSLIVPGLSFSTLLMPLGLYEPFVEGLGHLDFSVLLPGALGAFVTIGALSKVMSRLFQRHYQVSAYAILGIVIAATIMILPLPKMCSSVGDFILHVACILGGLLGGMLMSKFNGREKTTV